MFDTDVKKNEAEESQNQNTALCSMSYWIHHYKMIISSGKHPFIEKILHKPKQCCLSKYYQLDYKYIQHRFMDKLFDPCRLYWTPRAKCHRSATENHHFLDSSKLSYPKIVLQYCILRSTWGRSHITPWKFHEKVGCLLWLYYMMENYCIYT